MSQIWIFFVAGVGGDGLANLLENCQGVYSWQGPSRWRIDRIVDDQVKFWAPVIDDRHCFRSGSFFNQEKNHLCAEYEQAVADGRTIVVTSHDITLYNLDLSDRQDVLCRDQIKILMDSRDYLRCFQNSVKKNLKSVPVEQLEDPEWAAQNPLFLRYREVDRSRFDHVIYDEDLANDDNIRAFVHALGLEIDDKILEGYILLRSGRWRQVADPARLPERYESYVEDQKICYKQLD